MTRNYFCQISSSFTSLLQLTAQVQSSFAVRMMTPALLSAALLLLLLPAPPAAGVSHTPITILVSNSVANAPNQTYSTSVVFRGILLGGLRRLQDANGNFTFTYTDNKDYGPFLQSVNGLAGNITEGTYWELLVKTEENNTFRPDVGIGCYIPSENDQIILNFKYF